MKNKEKNYVRKENLFRYALLANTLIIAALFGGILYSLISESQLSIKKYSLGFLYDEIWQPLVTTDERTNDSLITVSTAVATDNNYNFEVAIVAKNNSTISHKSVKFNLYANYPLEKFSSTNRSRVSDMSIESVLLKDSAGVAYDATDLFDCTWDYYTQHSNNFFEIALKAKDSISILQSNSEAVVLLSFDNSSIYNGDFKNSWTFKKHEKEIDGHKADAVKILNLSSFEDFKEDQTENETFDSIATYATINKFIMLSSIDNEDDEEYQICGYEAPSEKYGALPYIIGTILTSFLALLIATPFALSIAIFLGEYYRDAKIATVLRSLIELISAIPSVIYGFWGLVVLVPIIAKIGSLYGIETSGISIISASIILAFMIIPYMATVSAEVIKMVPNDLKEAAYGLGATKFEVITKVILPYTKSGIVSGIILSLGRGLGETMAVTMLIGNVTGKIVGNLFEPSNTMASIIANNFAEAGSTLMSSLIEIALILFVLTSIISFIGRYYIRKGIING